MLRLVVVNSINEPLETGPGPVFKVTCNITNQLPKSVPACREVKKNKLLLAQTAGFPPTPHQALTAFVEDWLVRQTEVASNNIYKYIYHIYGYWKKEMKS